MQRLLYSIMYGHHRQVSILEPLFSPWTSSQLFEAHFTTPYRTRYRYRHYHLRSTLNQQSCLRRYKPSANSAKVKTKLDASTSKPTATSTTESKMTVPATATKLKTYIHPKFQRRRQKFVHLATHRKLRRNQTVVFVPILSKHQSKYRSAKRRKQQQTYKSTRQSILHKHTVNQKKTWDSMPDFRQVSLFLWFSPLLGFVFINVNHKFFRLLSIY